MRIVVLAGQAGHGKDTAADVFVEHDFQRMPLAGPLKGMIRDLLIRQGMSGSEAMRRTDGDLKETPEPLLCGVTPRRAMQTLGTEWGRGLDNLFWLECWSRMVNGLDAKFAKPAGVVVTDCRFENEGAYLKALGAELYAVRRPGFTRDVVAHSSEDLSWAEGEEVIWNDGYATAGDFQDSVRARFFS